MRLSCCKLVIQPEWMSCFLWMRKWFLEVGSTPGEDAVKMVGVTAADLECDVRLVAKPSVGSESLTPTLKGVLWGRSQKRNNGSCQYFFLSESCLPRSPRSDARQCSSSPRVPGSFQPAAPVLELRGR